MIGYRIRTAGLSADTPFSSKLSIAIQYPPRS